MTATSTLTSHYFTTPVKYLAAGVCLAVLLAACQTPEQKVAETKENVTNAKQDLKEANRDARAQWQEDWLAFKRDNDKDIAANERRIIDLRQQVNGADSRYRATYNARIDELERRNNELRERVNNCRDGEDEKWGEFKENTKRNMDNLKALLGNVTIKNG
jgi:predicted  nucleic acid-binding Zn-ribbon protein